MEPPPSSLHTTWFVPVYFSYIHFFSIRKNVVRYWLSRSKCIRLHPIRRWPLFMQTFRLNSESVFLYVSMGARARRETIRRNCCLATISFVLHNLAQTESRADLCTRTPNEDEMEWMDNRTRVNVFFFIFRFFFAGEWREIPFCNESLSTGNQGELLFRCVVHHIAFCHTVLSNVRERIGKIALHVWVPVCV